MKKINVRHLNIKRIASSKIPNNFYKRDILLNNPLKINKNYFQEPNKETQKNKNKRTKKNINEEEKGDINIFNKTFSNKNMFSRITPKDNLYKLNNPKSSFGFKQIPVGKKLPRNMSSNSFSKDSTLYKTKNRLLSSVKLEKLKNKNQTIAISPKRSTFYPKKARSLSASALNILSKNSLKKPNEMLSNKTFGNGGFITALDPVVGENQVGFNQSHDRDDNRSYFMRKLKDEKRFLSYFDIQRILFLDRRVYKPDMEFERKIYQLKNDNSDEFITNFNLDKYRITILRLFQRQVSSKNFEIMKKNFENINKGWRLRENKYKRRRKIVRNPTSETEREIKYNQLKMEREKRIQEKYAKKKKQ